MNETTNGHITHGPASLIGLVDGSVAATTSTFTVVLDPRATVQLDDLVTMRSVLPDGTEVEHYGIITEVLGQVDGAQYASDSLRIAGRETIAMPGEPFRLVNVRILRSRPELWVPPNSLCEVHHARGADREFALFLDQMDEQRLPVGVDQSGQPVYVDFAFLNGEKGGHVSISGISGVATKTSFACSVLYHLLETPAGQRLLGPHSSETRAVVFNLKGEDLLHLDRPNNRWAQHPEAAAWWEAMGVDKPGAFTDVTFFVPPMAGGGTDGIVPDVSSRVAEEVTVYGWTPLEFIRRGLLSYCFSDGDTGSTQIAFVMERVRLLLAQHWAPVIGLPGAVVLKGEPLSKSTNFRRLAQLARSAVQPGEGTLIQDFSDLVDFVSRTLDPTTGDAGWTGNSSSQTLLAFLRRLQGQVLRMGHLITTGVEAVSLRSRVNVVDIHQLDDDAQRFVVGALLAEIFDSKQGSGREPLRLIVLDELNKYAPRSGRSPIKDVLTDIGARGRSLGVILIGAQQSGLDVDANLIRNSSIHVMGRLDAGEADGYRRLSAELRDRAARFLPGTMVLDQPTIPAPIPFKFPFPPFATNVAEGRQRVDANAPELSRILGRPRR
jgi:DNA helicase HerA-like ATPase